MDAAEGLCRMTKVVVPAEGTPCLYFMRIPPCAACPADPAVPAEACASDASLAQGR
jgi:hypothetical protein